MGASLFRALKWSSRFTAQRTPQNSNTAAVQNGLELQALAALRHPPHGTENLNTGGSDSKQCKGIAIEKK